jgi:hypothetical protein
VDEMEDCIEIDPYLLNKEDLSISTSTTIASTLTKKTIGEFLNKDEQIEKESTPNPMVNHLSNPEKLVMSPNSIINNSCLKHSLLGQMLNYLSLLIHRRYLNSFLAIRLLSLIILTLGLCLLTFPRINME